MLRFFLGLALGVAVGAAGIGGWWYLSDDPRAADPNGRGDAEERRLADAYADSLSNVGEVSSVEALERVAEGVWRVRLDRGVEGDSCYLLQLDRFAESDSGGLTGVLPVSCDD